MRVTVLRHTLAEKQKPHERGETDVHVQEPLRVVQLGASQCVVSLALAD